MLETSAIEAAENLQARLLLKLESFNPGGSVKDRAAFAMITDAERSGRLKPGGTIVEPTSGNTGIGLAWIGRIRGYNVVLTMPDTMSEERRRLLTGYGARLVLTSGKEGMSGAIRKAEEILAETPDAVMLGQFDNPANPETHRLNTAREIWEDTEGRVDMLVAGVGTGGTLSGCAAGLKQRNPAIRVVAVEPESSPVLSGGAAGPHRIQGIGAGFVPANYDASLVDEVARVSDADAVTGARMLAEKEGILTGISSGAALIAALREAKKEENRGKTIVAILPDTGERYLSTGLFE